MKCRKLSSLYTTWLSPIYKVIVLNSSFAYIENWINVIPFASTINRNLENSREVFYLPTVLPFPLFFLPSFLVFQVSFLFFPLCFENFFSYSFRVGLLATNSLVFLHLKKPKFPLIPEGYFLLGTESVGDSFPSLLRKRAIPSGFTVRDEKSAVAHVVSLMDNESFLFHFQDLSQVLRGLAMRCPGVTFFRFNLFGVHRAA